MDASSVTIFYSILEDLKVSLQYKGRKINFPYQWPLVHSLLHSNTIAGNAPRLLLLRCSTILVTSHYVRMMSTVAVLGASQAGGDKVAFHCRIQWTRKKQCCMAANNW